MSPDLLYQLALTMVPGIGPVQAKILVEHFGDASSVFKAKNYHLTSIEGIGEARAKNIRQFGNFEHAEKEMQFIARYGITPLFLNDARYPRRLLNCYDSPTLLFFKGAADLNASKLISVVGTRNHTEYGKHVTEKLIKELASLQVLVVSGLAYGIDALAHKSALKNNCATIGVLAHGLDQVYPSNHAALAKEMTRNGGLLTEFRSGTSPDKHNFPTRNRIVAGMSDAVIVVETGCKGGSMITAELANGYNKDVFAVPGKIMDHKSEGCNLLIRNNKAVLFDGTTSLLEIMGWEQGDVKKQSRNQRALFIELSPDEKKIIDILKEKESMHIDELYINSNLSSSSVAAAILSLELQNVIRSLPGKVYSLQ